MSKARKRQPRAEWDEQRTPADGLQPATTRKAASNAQARREAFDMIVADADHAAQLRDLLDRLTTEAGHLWQRRDELTDASRRFVFAVDNLRRAVEANDLHAAVVFAFEAGRLAERSRVEPFNGAVKAGQKHAVAFRGAWVDVTGAAKARRLLEALGDDDETDYLTFVRSAWSWSPHVDDVRQRIADINKRLEAAGSKYRIRSDKRAGVVRVVPV